MQLNVTTDYAIRMTLLLALSSTGKNAAEISESMRIPQNYIVPIARRLREAGVIDSVRGQNGGYVLVREPWDLNLLELIEIMEGTTRINRCLEPDHFCSRNACEICPVRRSYQRLQNMMDDTLAGITLEELLRSETEAPAAEEAKA